MYILYYQRQIIMYIISRGNLIDFYTHLINYEMNPIYVNERTKQPTPFPLRIILWM